MSSSSSSCPSLFSSFFFSLSFAFALHLSALSVLKTSLSRSRRRIRVSHSSSLSLSLSLSLRLTSFHPELRYCKLPTCLYCLARFVSSSLQSMIPVRRSVLIPPASFIAPTLASYAASCSRGEPERARDSPLFTLRVGVPATEQISNKWDGCAKPRRFNYWCLVAAHRESRTTAPASFHSLALLPFFRLLSSFRREHSPLS